MAISLILGGHPVTLCVDLVGVIGVSFRC